MKNTLTSLLVGLLFVPSAAFAQSPSPDIQSLIASLLRQVQELQGQLKLLKDNEVRQTRSESKAISLEKEKEAYDTSEYSRLSKKRAEIYTERVEALASWKERDCKERYGVGTVAKAAQDKRCSPLRIAIDTTTDDLLLIDKKLDVLGKLKSDIQYHGQD